MIQHTVIRPILSDDIEQICAIEKKAHSHPWSKQLLQDAITSYYNALLLIEGQAIGYYFFKTVLTEAELLDIAIDPLYQNQGYGRLLLSHLLEELEKKKVTDCFLEVRESNLPAQHLYENMGFNEVGRRTNYYPTTNNAQEDALIMVYSII